MTTEDQQSATMSSSDGEGVYVYCIAEANAARAIVHGSLPSALEDDSRLALITAGSFAAVTSRVPLSMYGEDSLNENLNDPSWTALRAMQHQNVVEFFAKQTGVVPLRFGTVYLSQENVEQMLSQRAADLQTIIDRINGCEEWGVNVFSDRPKLIAAVTELSPKLRALSEQAETSAPGQAYLLKKKVEGLRAEEARHELSRLLDELESKLSSKTKGMKRLRMLKVEATESGDLKAKFAFLVERAHFDDFRDAAEQLALEMDPLGIRLELTGPWPAYNFAG